VEGLLMTTRDALGAVMVLYALWMLAENAVIQTSISS